jgi:aquaporin related protein
MLHLPIHREPKHQQDGNANGHRSERPPPRLSTLQAHLVAASGEFVGTFMFLYFSFACQTMLNTQASEKSLLNGGSSSQQNIFTALVYGFSLLVNVWAFYRISGGLFNPAVCILIRPGSVSTRFSIKYRALIISQVTFGMVIAGTLPPIRGLILFPAQILAGMCAGALVSCMFPGDIATTNTTLSPGTSIAQGVFIEMFMTAELVFVVLMLAAEKSKDTFIAPVGIGLALFVAMMGGTSPFLRVHSG